MNNSKTYRLEQSQLLWILPRISAALIREMHDITILPVGKIENLDVASWRQRTRDAANSCLKRFFTVDETGINGKLASLETFVQQEISEFCGCLALRFGVGGKVKHHKYPHKAVS